MITGHVLPPADENVTERIHYNLVKHGLIKDGYIAIIMGSPSDKDHGLKMKKIIESYDIRCELRVVSAHKNGEQIPVVTKDYNLSLIHI